MTPEERIIALEYELHDTRRAAAAVILGMVDAVAQTPEGREELARSFDEAAKEAGDTDPALARLVSQVAGMIRERARRASQAEDNE